MKLIIYHPQGNANVRATAIALAEENLLAEFHTTIACFPGSFLGFISGLDFLSEIRRRSYDISLRQFTHTSPFIELGRLMSKRAGLKKL